ncbi:MAG: radical SAM protein [Candidatus Woesearchaeota archaeon]
MKKAGVTCLKFGIESGSQRLLNIMNKGIRVKDAIELNKKLSEINIKVLYSFMVGLSTERKKERKKTIEVALQLVKENKNAKIEAIYPFLDYYKLVRSGGMKSYHPELMNICKYSIGIYNSRLTLHSLRSIAAKIYYSLAKARLKKGFYSFQIDYKIKSILWQKSYRA